MFFLHVLGCALTRHETLKDIHINLLNEVVLCHSKFWVYSSVVALYSKHEVQYKRFYGILFPLDCFDSVTFSCL